MAGRSGGNVIAIEATEAIIENRFVTPDGKHTAAAKPAGVSLFDTDDTDMISVQRGGVNIVEAGGVVAVGGKLKSDADGKAVAHTIRTDSVANLAADIESEAGVALTAATASGQLIEILMQGA